MIAVRFPELEIIATEVDTIQHEKNLLIGDLSNVTFQYGGAEKIDLADASINFVIMLKSLHHVPMELIGQSLCEIKRVLVPGGLAYLSEPVYDGDFNGIMKLFHDERIVRNAAFASVSDAVRASQFELVEQIFFDSLMTFQGFEEFESRILGATHSTFQIDERMHAKIKAAYLPFVNSHGVAEFRTPIRVDLLRRPS